MKIFVIILNILATLALVPAAAAAIMSPMAFDAPGSEELNGTWIFFIAMATLPIVIVIGQVLSWVFFAKKNYKAALICSLLPVFVLIILLLSTLIF